MTKIQSRLIALFFVLQGGDGKMILIHMFWCCHAVTPLRIKRLVRYEVLPESAPLCLFWLSLSFFNPGNE